MDELQMRKASLVCVFQSLQIAFQEITAFRRDHDAGRACSDSTIEIFDCDDFDQLFALMVFVQARKPVIKVFGELAWPGLAEYPQPALERAYHRAVGNDFTRDDEHAVRYHGRPHAVDSPQDAGMAVHVGETQRALCRERTGGGERQRACQRQKIAPRHGRVCQRIKRVAHGQGCCQLDLRSFCFGPTAVKRA